MERSERQKRQEEIMNYREEVEKELKKYPNVLGVGVGLKEKDRKLSENIVYRVYVSKKVDRESLKNVEAIPHEMRGFDTDVIEIAESTKDNDKVRPILGGIGISAEQDATDWSGTLGCVVSDRNSGKTPLILTCHHLLYGSGKDDPVYQPYKPDVVGQRNRGSDDGEYIDCAVAKVTVSGSDYTKNKIQGDVNVVGTENAPTVGDTVYKYGKSTGWTEGRIIDIAATTVIGTDTYKDQIQIQGKSGKFAEGGDSGSVVLVKKNSDNNYAVIGLHMSSQKTSPYNSYENKISRVIGELKIDIG